MSKKKKNHDEAPSDLPVDTVDEAAMQAAPLDDQLERAELEQLAEEEKQHAAEQLAIEQQDEEEAERDADLLFGAGRFGPLEIEALEELDGGDWGWTLGAHLVFQCAACGVTAACAPPGSPVGLSNAEARAEGWHIPAADEEKPVWCPRCAELASEPESHGQRRTRQVWRGSHWAAEAVPAGEGDDEEKTT